MCECFTTYKWWIIYIFQCHARLQDGFGCLKNDHCVKGSECNKSNVCQNIDECLQNPCENGYECTDMPGETADLLVDKISFVFMS